MVHLSILPGCQVGGSRDPVPGEGAGGSRVEMRPGPSTPDTCTQ